MWSLNCFTTYMYSQLKFFYLEWKVIVPTFVSDFHLRVVPLWRAHTSPPAMEISSISAHNGARLVLDYLMSLWKMKWNRSLYSASTFYPESVLKMYFLITCVHRTCKKKIIKIKINSIHRGRHQPPYRAKKMIYLRNF